MQYITCFIKKKKNNIFINFYFLKKSQYYNLGTLTKNITEKPFFFIVEQIFSIIILKMKQYNIHYINLISNDKRFFKNNIISLLFLNFTKYNIKLLKFSFVLNTPHNGCRQKKNITLNKNYFFTSL